MIGILTIKRWRYNWEIVNKFELLVDDWFGVVPSGVSLSETVLAGLRDAVVTIIDIIGLSKNGISQNLLVSQSFFLIKLHWLVVSNIWIIFHFIYGRSSFPLTNSIIFQDGYCTTNQCNISAKNARIAANKK